MVACKEWNELPAETVAHTLPGSYQNRDDFTSQTWTVVRFAEQTTGNDMQWLFAKTQCMHCSNAPCVSVCPTGAMQKDGTVTYLDETKCVGEGYCVTACPFGAVAFDEGKGIVQKCTMCIDRIRPDPCLREGVPGRRAALRRARRHGRRGGEARQHAEGARRGPRAHVRGRRARRPRVPVRPEGRPDRLSAAGVAVGQGRAHRRPGARLGVRRGRVRARHAPGVVGVQAARGARGAQRRAGGELRCRLSHGAGRSGSTSSSAAWPAAPSRWRRSSTC
ncbi:MAG: hypothetical protein HYU87_06370 [Chloroflexi bacterium]|nr:hypothetical protein [Chloroflexota bacterium]